MVWMFSSDSVTDSRKNGPSTYYFTKGGSYSVGRKDCTVVINTDKAVSRLHAELVVEDAPPFEPSAHEGSSSKASIKVKDKSKLGTFVNRHEGTPATPVLSLPGGEATLKDGDVVTFGTNDTKFRLSFSPLVLSIPNTLEPSKRRQALENAKAIGANVVNSWHPSCTHLVVADRFPLSPLVTAAVAAGRPLVTLEWLQAFAARGSPDAPLPTPESFQPTVLLKEVSQHEGKGGAGAQAIVVASPDARRLILQGFTFLLGPPQLYEENLEALLRAFGGTVEDVRAASLQAPASSQHLRQYVWVAPGSKAGQEPNLELPPQALSLTRKLHWIGASALIGATLAASSDWNALLQAPDPAELDAMSGSTADTEDESDPVAEVDSAAPRGGTSENVTGAESEGWKSFSRMAATQPLPESEAGSCPIRGAGNASSSLPGGGLGQHPSTSNGAPCKQNVPVPRMHTPEANLPKSRLDDRSASEGLQAGQEDETRVQSQQRREAPGVSSQVAFGFSRKLSGVTKGGVEKPTLRGAVKDKAPAQLANEDESRERKPGQLKEEEEMKTSNGAATAGNEQRSPTAHAPAVESKVDVLYAPLIVTSGGSSKTRAANAPDSPQRAAVGHLSGGLANFKQFRKVGGGVLSGNSFTTLVPFAKEPYRESDLAKEVGEYMQREKRRKAHEAAAEDLFNADKLKRQKVAAGGGGGGSVPPKPPRARAR